MTAATEVPWGPAADGLDQPYWDGLVAGELRLQRCSECQTWIWGPQSICPECYSLDLAWESTEPVGTVYTWNRSFYPFVAELTDRLPYTTVLVELPNAGNRRVYGILIDDDENPPRIGDEVAGFFEHVEGEPWPLLRWRRVEAVNDTEGATA